MTVGNWNRGGREPWGENRLTHAGSAAGFSFAEITDLASEGLVGAW